MDGTAKLGNWLCSFRKQAKYGFKSTSLENYLNTFSLFSGKKGNVPFRDLMTLLMTSEVLLQLEILRFLRCST